MNQLKRCLEIVIGLVFLASGSSKLISGFEFLHTVSGYQMLGWQMTLVVATALPWLELTVGAVLVVGLMSEAALWLSTSLTIVFAIAGISALHRNLAIPCGCFGTSEVVSGLTVLRSCGICALSGTASAITIQMPHRERLHAMPA